MKADAALLRRHRHLVHMLVQHHAGERIELADPRLSRQHRPRVGIASIPALRMPDGLKSMSLVWVSRSSCGASSRTTCMRVGQP